MTRSLPALFVAIALLPAGICAQQMPSFSGVWELDAARSDDQVYGQRRVISQTPAEIQMTVFHVASGQTLIWSLSDDGMTMIVEGISTRISPSFDFRVTLVDAVDAHTVARSRMVAKRSSRCVATQ